MGGESGSIQLLRCLITLLTIDGRIGAKERELLDGVRLRLGVPAETLEGLLEETLSGKPHAAVPSDLDLRRRLLNILAAAASVDGEVSPDERRILDAVARRMAIAQGEPATLLETPPSSGFVEAASETLPDPQALPRRKLGVGTRLGKYVLLDYLGRGAMGAVFKAMHEELGRVFALKVMRSIEGNISAFERFQNEARFMARLSHPNIVSVLDAGVADGFHYFTMEYVDGGTLAEWIAGKKVACLETTLDIAIQLARGLNAAHEEGLVHRDVKPGNCMMSTDGVAKISDFGVARAVTPHLLFASFAGGTPAYWSPEQAFAHARRESGPWIAKVPQFTRTIDVWSWGLCVLEMLAGERFWQHGQAAGEVLHSWEGAAGRGVPPEILSVLRRCFQADPAKRWPTLDQAAFSLITSYRHLFGRDYPRQSPTPSPRGH